MRAPDLIQDEWYAVKWGKEVVKALFRGHKTPPAPKNRSQGWSIIRPCFSTLDGNGVEITFYLPSCHRVICPWDEYGSQDRELIYVHENDICKADAISEGVKDAIFQIQAEDVETLALLLSTFDVDAGISVVTCQVGDKVNTEPALFIRHKDVSKMMRLARDMALYSDTSDLLD